MSRTILEIGEVDLDIQGQSGFQTSKILVLTFKN